MKTLNQAIANTNTELKKRWDNEEYVSEHEARVIIEEELGSELREFFSYFFDKGTQLTASLIPVVIIAKRKRETWRRQGGRYSFRPRELSYYSVSLSEGQTIGDDTIEEIIKNANALEKERANKKLKEGSDKKEAFVQKLQEIGITHSDFRELLSTYNRLTFLQQRELSNE
ncbi:MAG: hypothetical protein GQ474_05930 [Sulfurimonas sp.]|nr:hypothetical protein [Sulfurimonas sp.]